MKMKNGKAPCPCGSKRTLDTCCGLYIYGNSHAPDPEALMRSRYTANVRKAFKYLAQTWHPTTRPSSLSNTGKIPWIRLEVITTKTQNTKAWVEFKAIYGHGNHEHGMHEKSEFVLEAGQWWYLDGEILSQDSCGH